MTNNMAQTSTLLYHDAKLGWLVDHAEYGFSHPVSGDELARISSGTHA